MDIILTQRFLPERGGSIQWLVNLFRESPTPFKVITNQYSEPTENPFTNAKLIQDKILLSDWGITSIDSLLKYFKMWRMLSKELVTGEINYIHCSKILPEGFVAVITKLLTFKKVKIICFAHGEEFKAYNSSRQLKFLYKLIIKRIDLIVANSNFTKQQLLKLPNPKRIEVLHPCINLSDFESTKSKSELRKLYGFEDSDKILLTVGRLTPRKNQIGVLKVIIDHYLTQDHIKYLMIGTGEQQQELQDLINLHNLTHRVQILSNVSDEQKKDYYHLSDIFVMPSIDTGYDLEGFGMVYVEAQACGLPVICGNSGGEIEAIEGNQSSFFVSNQHDLGEVLMKLVDNECNNNFDNSRLFAEKFSALENYQSYQSFVSLK